MGFPATKTYYVQFLKTGFQKVKSALAKTRSVLGGKIKALFGQPWDEETFESLRQFSMRRISDQRVRKSLLNSPNSFCVKILKLPKRRS